MKLYNLNGTEKADVMEMSDTGWIDLTLLNGITGTLRYKIKNGILTVDGAISNVRSEYATLCELPKTINIAYTSYGITYYHGAPNTRGACGTYNNGNVLMFSTYTMPIKQSDTFYVTWVHVLD